MSLPAATDIAFALAIFRSKPDNLNIRDYIQILRASRKAGHRGSSECQSDSHLDTVTFWRSECRRLNNEKDKLEAIIVNLKHVNNNLKASSEIPPGAQALDRTTGKDKSANDAGIRRTLGSITTKTSNLMQTVESTLGSNTSLESLEHGGILAKGVYRLHKLVAESSPDSHELSTVLSASASALNVVLQSATKRIFEEDQAQGTTATHSRTPISSFVSDIRAAGRIHASLVRGFDVLDVSGAGNRLRGPVVYHITQVFQTAVTAVDSAAARNILSEASRPVSRNSRVANSTNKSTTSDTMTAMTTIKQLAISMLNSLDPSKSAHDDLFEGFMFILLQHIGQKLYLLTFEQVPTREVVKDIIAAPAEEKELQTATIAAPHMVDILKIALSRAPKHLRPRTSGSDRLSDAARIKLQRTLVHCTFGKEGMMKEALADCLKPAPAMELDTRSRPTKKGKNNKQSDGDWFVNEIWGLLGWDILGQEGEMSTTGEE